MDLSFEDLSLRARGGRLLLDHVSGRFRQGELGVVLGPSGAGKTTLLQVLAGRLRQDAGVVRLNGQAAPPSQFWSHSVYPSSAQRRETSSHVVSSKLG